MESVTSASGTTSTSPFTVGLGDALHSSMKAISALLLRGERLDRQARRGAFEVRAMGLSEG